MPDIAQHRMQFTGMLASSMVCFWCHDGSSGPVAHGYIVGPGDSYLPIAKTGTIDVAGSDCAGCHTSGMSSPSDPLAPADVPQVEPGHSQRSRAAFTMSIAGRPDVRGGLSPESSDLL